MQFNELDKTMRVYETAADLSVLPDLFMVARLDGRSFTRLTKELCPFEAPFDAKFRDLMVETARSLLTCGFRVRFAVTASDEISLLLDPTEQQFGRKLRKYVSTLAGEASAQFSIRLGRAASFDCRISQLPTPERVVDYFRWRSEDTARNALSAWCYWTLRKEGVDARDADRCLLGLSGGQKNELLFRRGINFNDLPNWQKRGVGLFWEEYDKPSTNPKTGQPVTTRRKRIRAEFELPARDGYNDYVRTFVSSPCSVPGAL